MGVKKNLLKIFNFTRKNYLYIFGAALLFGIFFINTFHESYPDEFDNILGGKYILEGKIIYKDFFTHHGPTSYFLSALNLIFSGNSFVNFRIVYSIFLFLLTIGGYLYLRRSIGDKITRFYLPLMFLIGIAATYFWGHMILADSLSAFLLLPVFTLLILKTIYKKSLTLWDTAFIGILATLTLLSSLSYFYLIGFLYIYLLYYYLKSNELSLTTKSTYYSLIKFFAILAAPVVAFSIYLLATWSFQEYFYQNFTFNQMYYIYNYPRPEGTLTINPIRYMVVITHNFLINFTVLLEQIAGFNFSFPYNITLALGSASLIVYLLFKRQWALAFLVLLILIFSNVRSNPLESQERDYQMAVFMLFSLMAGFLTLKLLYDELKRNTIHLPHKVIFASLFLLLSVYTVFNVFYLTRSFSNKTYGKYMGTHPRIYDRPQIAPFINDVLQEGEYTWIGPFEFEELFYTKRPIASRYQIYNSAQGRAPHVGGELIEDFENTKPKMIWFDKKFHILGANPEEYAQEFINYLDNNYYTLLEYEDEDGTQYVPDYPFEDRVDIETKLYIRQENIDEIISRLLEKGYIKPQEEE